MKRALAERAKQESFDTVKAPKPPPPVATDHSSSRTPQQPPSIPANSSSLSGLSRDEDPPSSNNHLPIDSKQLQNAGDATPADRTVIPNASGGTDTGNSAASPGSASEPPKKIPRLERLSGGSSSNNVNHNASSIPQSPRSPRNLPKKNVLDRTTSMGAFQPPSKRRFSGDNEDSSSSKYTKKRIKDDSENEEEEDSNSAFYLKHQNRALATELKSLQFAVKQLETERDARRQHCFDALQSINELRNTWSFMEEQTVGTASSTTHLAPTAPEHSNLPPSDDSLETTRIHHHQNTPKRE